MIGRHKFNYLLASNNSVVTVKTEKTLCSFLPEFFPFNSKNAVGEKA
jgi:hypothetical protein